MRLFPEQKERSLSMKEEWEDEEYEDEEEEDEDIQELIKAEKREILREMAKLPRTSQEYMVLAQRLADITECARNEAETIKEEKQADQIDHSKYSWLLPTVFQTGGMVVGQVLGQVLNRKTVNDVVNYEKDGGIVTSKAGSFIQKPRS